MGPPARQGEDHQHQPDGGHNLGEPVRPRGPVLGRDGDGGLGEHDIGKDRPTDAPDNLERQIPAASLHLRPPNPASTKETIGLK